MAQQREGVGTYRVFADTVLPRIKADGYTAVQLMAVAEHPLSLIHISISAYDATCNCPLRYVLASCNFPIGV